MHGARWMWAAILAFAPSSALATPSEAATLGGLDLYYPNELDSFMYFESDLNLFVNPALAQRYRNRVQVNLGFAPGGAIEGSGTNPRGVALLGVGDHVTLGVALNRSPGELGEKAALGRTIDQLTTGNTGEIRGGTFDDPLSAAGLAAPTPSAPLQAPLDLFGAYHTDAFSLGANVYAAFGRAASDSEAELVAGGFDGDWTKTTSRAVSSYVGGTVGLLVPSDAVATEAWLRVTRVGAWADARAFGPAPRGKWDPPADALVDRTIGLAGTWRLGGGGRVVVPLSDDLDLTASTMLDYAFGSVFGTDRLADDPEDPDETAAAQAEDDSLRASTLTVRAGTGFAWRPEEALEVVTTVSGQGDVDHTRFDDRANVLKVVGSTHQAADLAVTVLRLPVVSLGARYAFTEAFTVRGAIRSTPVLHRLRTSAVSRTGDAVDDWKLQDAAVATTSVDVGDAPPLTAAIGPGVHLGSATLDGALGGAFAGAGYHLFSRIDVNFSW